MKIQEPHIHVLQDLECNICFYSLWKKNDRVHFHLYRTSISSKATILIFDATIIAHDHCF